MLSKATSPTSANRRSSVWPTRPRQLHPDPGACESTNPFLLPIEDVFSISGRGTVVTGRVERAHRQGW